MLLKIIRILNPVLAVAQDETGTLNLFSANGEDSLLIRSLSGECPPKVPSS